MNLLEIAPEKPPKPRPHPRRPEQFPSLERPPHDRDHHQDPEEDERERVLELRGSDQRHGQHHTARHGFAGAPLTPPPAQDNPYNTPHRCPSHDWLIHVLTAPAPTGPSSPSSPPSPSASSSCPFTTSCRHWMLSWRPIAWATTAGRWRSARQPHAPVGDPGHPAGGRAPDVPHRPPVLPRARPPPTSTTYVDAWFQRHKRMQTPPTTDEKE